MTAVAKLANSFVETSIDAEVVLMRLSDGDFFSLDGTAVAVWQAIDGDRDRAEIVAAVGEQFGEAAGVVAADVNAFLDELAAAGVIAG